MATRHLSESVIACNARLGLNLEGMWDDESNGDKYFVRANRHLYQRYDVTTYRLNGQFLHSEALIRYDGFRLTWGRSYTANVLAGDALEWQPHFHRKRTFRWRKSSSSLDRGRIFSRSRSPCHRSRSRSDKGDGDDDIKESSSSADRGRQTLVGANHSLIGENSSRNS